MERLTLIFNHPGTPWVIGGLLVLTTLVVLARWASHLGNLRNAIRVLRDAMELNSAFQIKEDHLRWQYFARERYEAAKQQLSEIRDSTAFAAQVLSYLDRCSLARNEASGMWHLETAVHPSDALRLETHFLNANIHVPLFRAFPNYLVGAGLCITFLGLAVVIGNASAVLAPGNSGDSSLALHDLLVAASSKFWSSLAAVACSIVYGICFRTIAQRMEQEAGLLARDLGKYIRIVSPEELHYESVQQARKSVEYQSLMATNIGLLKTGLENTHASGENHHQDLLEKLGAVADSIGHKIGSMGSQLSDGLGKINEAAFAEIAQQMMDSLHKATEIHLKTIAERLEGVSRTLAKIPAEFESLVGLVQENTDTIAEAFALAAEPIENSLVTASASAKQVAASFAALPDALAPAQSAANNLQTAAGTISEMVARIHSQNESLARRWEDLSGLIQSTDQHLAKSVDKVGGIFPEYAEKLRGFSEEWEKAMITALNGLTGNIKDLSSSHEELRIQRSAWKDTAETLGGNLEAISSQLPRLVDSLSKRSVRLQQASVTDMAPPVVSLRSAGENAEAGPPIHPGLEHGRP